MRCISSLEFEPAPEGALVFGGNAQGKTTLLEAICVLLRLRSPRTNRLHSLIRHGERGFRILGRVAEQELDVLYSQDEKRILLNGAPPASTADYLKIGLVTWIANDDLKIVHDGGVARRGFLDFLCAQLDGGYAAALRNYRQALQQRNALLRERPVDWSAIGSFDEPLANAGDELRKLRRAGVEALRPFAEDAYREISGAEEFLEISYLDNAEASLRESLARCRTEDARLRSTSRGPHRDSLILNLNGRPVEEFGSEGQQRSCVLALKLGQFALIRKARGQAPVLLLDDVFGELDPRRREALASFLPSNAQCFITTTSPRWLEDCGLQLARYEMTAGSLRHAKR